MFNSWEDKALETHTLAVEAYRKLNDAIFERKAMDSPRGQRFVRPAKAQLEVDLWRKERAALMTFIRRRREYSTALAQYRDLLSRHGRLTPGVKESFASLLSWNEEKPPQPPGGPPRYTATSEEHKAWDANIAADVRFLVIFFIYSYCYSFLRLWSAGPDTHIC